MVVLSRVSIDFFSLTDHKIFTRLLTSWGFEALRQTSAIPWGSVVCCVSLKAKECICTTRHKQFLKASCGDERKVWYEGSLWQTCHLGGWKKPWQHSVFDLSQVLLAFFQLIYCRAEFLLALVWRLQPTVRKELWAQHPCSRGYFLIPVNAAGRQSTPSKVLNLH